HVPGQLGEVRVVQLRDGQRQHAGALGSQVAGGQVGPVTEPLDGRLDLRPGDLADVWIVVDDVGHRLDGDPGEGGHILQAHGHLRRLPRGRAPKRVLRGPNRWRLLSYKPLRMAEISSPPVVSPVSSQKKEPPRLWFLT